MTQFQRPDPTEHSPFYTGYIAAVPEGDILDLLEVQGQEVAELLGGLDDAGARHRYAPGKWSIKEVLGHLIDAERIFAYRLLCVARGDTTSLPGFDENTYADASGADERPLPALLDEFAAVRQATVLLLRGLHADTAVRMGMANGQPVSTRAIAYTIAGHAGHHLGVLRERYGLGAATAS